MTPIRSFEVELPTGIHWLTRNNFLLTTTNKISVYTLQGWMSDINVEINGIIVNSCILEDNLLLCTDLGTIYWIKVSEDYFE